MHFQIHQSTFLKLVKDASQCAHKKNVLLRNIRITAGGAVVSAATFNGDQMLELNDVAVVHVSGSASVDHKILVDQLKALGKTLLQVRREDSEYGAELVIEGEDSTLRIPTVETDFPEMKGEKITSATIEAEQMRAIITRLSWAVASYDQSSILGGVSLAVANGKLLACATDGSRMSTFEDQAEGALVSVIPADVWKVLDKILPKIGAVFFSLLENGQIVITAERMQLMCRPIEGQYPRYQELFPQEFLTVYEFDRKKLLAAVLACGKVADERTNLLKVSLNGKAELSARTPDAGAFKTSLPYSATVENETQFALNCRYFADYLSSSEADVITLGYTGPLKPLVFTDSDTRVQHLLMPVQAK